MLVRGASNWFFCCLLVRKRKVKEDEGIASIKACGNLVSYWVSLVEHGLDLRDAWGVPFFLAGNLLRSTKCNPQVCVLFSMFRCRDAREML